MMGTNGSGNLCKNPVAALCERREVVDVFEKRRRSQTAATTNMIFAEISSDVDFQQVPGGWRICVDIDFHANRPEAKRIQAPHQF